LSLNIPIAFYCAKSVIDGNMTNYKVKSSGVNKREIQIVREFQVVKSGDEVATILPLEKQAALAKMKMPLKNFRQGQKILISQLNRASVYLRELAALRASDHQHLCMSLSS
jgi:hypothetical protein